MNLQIPAATYLLGILSVLAAIRLADRKERGHHKHFMSKLKNEKLKETGSGTKSDKKYKHR